MKEKLQSRNTAKFIESSFDATKKSKVQERCQSTRPRSTLYTIMNAVSDELLPNLTQ